MSLLPVWKFILSQLENSEPVVLLCVLQSHGSSPGRQGFKMAVSTREMVGSIGGGIMEHKFVELAKERLNEIQFKPIVRKQIHNKSADKNQSGMICSGDQTVLIMNVNRESMDDVRRLVDSQESFLPGSLTLTPGSLSFSSQVNDTDYYFSMQNEDDWLYRERIGFKNKIHIVGGGHCALALSRFLNSLDFHITLYDDRKELSTFDRNSFVHKKQMVDDYSQMDKFIDSGKNVYVVIMTFGYRTDDLALRALIRKDFKYLGILGSQSKMEKLFADWRKDNLPEEKLSEIFAPIGIPIHSRTPEEIAISIAAEVISVKNAE